jgi:alkylation response protein AidB-like acyl-CoA dehydrogenase
VFFGFDDDDQLAFRDAARDLLDKECPPAAVRAAWEAPAGTLDRTVWDRLADMGVPAALVPEHAGGLGLDEQALVLVLEEAGRAALPHPLVETAAVAAPLVAGGPGSAPVPAGVPDVHGLGMVATDLGGPHVPCAADADWLLLRDDASGHLHLVDPAAAVLTPVGTVDRARRAATVDWRPAPGSLVSDDPAAIDAAFDRGAFGTAALLLGLAQRMLDMTVAYVGERRQFGAPVGSFQAVKHHLANIGLRLTFARPAVYRAAWSLATDAPTRAEDVSLAKALASDTALYAGRYALQCHGAIGYTVEHDLHLYLKRSWALARTWGDRGFHADRVARALSI